MRRPATADRRPIPSIMSDIVLLHGALGAADQLAPLADETLGRVRCPSCVAVGDRDATETVEETAGAYRALPDAELAVLPRTAHPNERVDVDAIAALIDLP